MNFSFNLPVRIVSGVDCIKGNAPLLCIGKHALIVTGKNGAKKSGALDDVVEVLSANGIGYTVFDEITENPPIETCFKGGMLGAELGADFIIGIGGGSALDAAKAIAAFSANPSIAPMDIYDPQKRTSSSLPIIAIPTTSGTGSEVTSFSILTHDGVKHALIDPSIRPDYAILDPVLLQNLPKKLIAESGMDAVCHCIEAAAAKNSNAITLALASHGLKLLLNHLPLSFDGSQCSREAVHIAAAMAGMAFENAGLGAVHALAHALGGAHHVPHGRLCGILLPHVMEANAHAVYAELAAICGMASALQLRRAIISLRRHLQLPASLKDAGIGELDTDAIVCAAMKDPCIAGNPTAVTVEFLHRILKEAAG